MMGWILARVSGKAILWVALSMFGLNIAQFGWNKFVSSDCETDQEVITMAVNDALQKQQKSQDNQIIKEQKEYIGNLEKLNEVKDGLIIDRQSRGDRWKADAIKFKNKYNATRCEDGDDSCKAWGGADYRGDG